VRWSLKYKFIVTLVAFTFLLSVSFGFISIKRLSAELESQLLKEGIELVDDIAEMISRPTLDPFEMWERINFFLENYRREDVLYLQVVKDGEVIAGSLEPTVEGVASEGEAKAEVVKKRTEEGISYLDIKRILPSGIKIELPLGGSPRLRVEGPSYVRLGLSLAYVQSEIRSEILTISLVSGGFILAGVLVAFFFYQMILGPIEVLIESVKRFGVSPKIRARVKSGDELEILAQEFNKMADSIEEQAKKLKEANKVKSEFLAMMGHELKTPLHTIRGFSQLLLEGIDGPLTKDQQKDIEAILKSGNHLLELIENILRFSKLEGGEERLHIEEMDSSSIVKEALSSVESLVREKGIRIKTKVDPIRIKADGTKLKQVLINLLSNAVRYTKKGRVYLGAEVVDGKVLFKVEDSGIGIKEEHQGRIFEPFTQLDSSTTRESTGIGLGLAIVKKYVEMHGGEVWLESTPGKGSTFYFTIPLK
jgi:signal transduction histidine kinase